MNYKYFYSLLSKIYKDRQEQEQYKEHLVSEVTNGRTTSLKDITPKEYATLIVLLEDFQKINQNIKDARSATLKMLQKEFNIPTYNWDIVNALCMNPRIAGKPFYEISVEEHLAVRRRLYSILKKGGLKLRTPKKELNTIYIINPKNKTIS